MILNFHIMETFTTLYTIILTLKIITNTFRFYKNNFRILLIQKLKWNYKIYNQFIMISVSAHNIFSKIQITHIHPLTLIDNKLYIYVSIVALQSMIPLTIIHFQMTIDPRALLIIINQMLAQ